MSTFHKLGKNLAVGADGTPTKYIDQIAEDAALKIIEKSGLTVNILSEEAGFIDNKGKYTFILDPVDGTRNLVRGIPFYSVSLAIGKMMLHDVEYGIVKNIPTGDVFSAEKHAGAFLNKKRIAVADVPDKEPLICLSLGKHVDNQTLILAKRDYIRAFGCASLEMCMVATGALDYYVVGREYLRVTDIAAATLVVREARGFVATIDGEELDMELSLHPRTSIIATLSQDIIHHII